MTTTSPTTPHPVTGSLPPARATQQATNRTEEALIHFLLDGVVDEITGRSGGLHEFPWAPEQNVRIGVLRPTINPPEPQAENGSGSGGAAAGSGGEGEGSNGPPAAGAAGPRIPPSVENKGVIGFDFIVKGAPQSLTFTVAVSYALYHQLIPAFSAVQAEAVSRSAAAAGTKRRPSVTMNPTWRRDDRTVTFDVTIPVTADEETIESTTLTTGDPLAADGAAAVTAHFADPDALFRLTKNQTMPTAAALGTEAEFRQALEARRDTTWQPTNPLPKITASTFPTATGDTAVSVSLTNGLVLPARPQQDLSMYDARLIVDVASPASLEPQALGLAAEDCRYRDVATVAGRGRGCVAVPGVHGNQIVAETVPVYSQPVAVSADLAGLDIRFSELITSYPTTLAAIGSQMRTFHRNWDMSGATTADAVQQLIDLRDRFEAEVKRFELGCDLLTKDPMLASAFAMANDAFARAKGQNASWRLFQLCFIVTELGALAGRQTPTDPVLRGELDSVDVLWFPTGGGKTEAYLGLIAVALFFDRLRGKERGTTAWMLFPLRMLSVQQLARISQIAHHAELVRQDHKLVGDPFTLGYLVGGRNTPNRLAYAASDGWWPGADAFAKWDPAERDRWRLVGSCPRCNDSNGVGLDFDTASQRLIHICRSCSYVLPIHCSDDEVFRYQSSIVVSTVDKIASFAHNGELTGLNHGPRRQCPSHGWYSIKRCLVNDCKVDPSTHKLPKGFLDPTPSLWIQDELHLVREDLGVFAGHYHTLIAELARGAGHEPSKVIAATATIEQYEDQLSQVYGRRPRMFPTGGPTLARSFYSEVTEDVRRVYLGLLPAGGGTVKVDLAGHIVVRLVEAVHRLFDDPSPLIAALAAAGTPITQAEVHPLLFRYELALAYVNSKAHGVAIVDDLLRLSDKLTHEGSDRLRVENLTGETSLGELAAAVAAIQDDTLAVPRAQRIRALVGTSVVSHGVDLDRLNFEVLAGMPPTYADYIQATARAGRTFVGLVIDVFDRSNRREASMYQSFMTTHAALERMVAPVPVNRFASRAIERTLPGIMCALLWDEARNATGGTDDEVGRTNKFRPWWNREAASLGPKLRARIEAAYRCPVPDPSTRVEEQKLVDDALHRWEAIERQRMLQWQADRLVDLFTSPAMTSLRDVDVAVEFGGGSWSDQIVNRLIG